MITMLLKTKTDLKKTHTFTKINKLPCDFCEKWEEVKTHKGYVLCSECTKLYEIKRPQKHERIHLIL